MSLFASLVLLLSFYQISGDTATDGTDLVFSFMVHRHGNRTPIKSYMSYVNADQLEELEELIAPWGYGQLTNEGTRTGYKTGKFIRRRYDEFLSETFNKSEIYIRSTDSTRTKMTVLSSMAAVYPAIGDTWSDEINWVPVPYITVPAKYDFNVASLNCPVYSTAYSTILDASTTRMSEYDDVIEKLSNITGQDLSSTPVLAAATFYDLYVSQLSLGMDLGEEISELMPRLELAAGVAWDIIMGDEDYIALQAGVLLKEFFDAANSVIAGDDVPKVRVYSAHDFNVYSFEAVTAVNRQGAPKYGALYSLELRKVTATGQYVVLPVYLSSPESTLNETYLTVENCGGDVLCDFDTFYSLTSKYILDQDTWRTKCEWSNDMIFDTSSID